MKAPLLWRNRDYMVLRGGQFISSLGSGVSYLAFPLLVLAITRSPALTGLSSAVQILTRCPIRPNQTRPKQTRIAARAFHPNSLPGS